MSLVRNSLMQGKSNEFGQKVGGIVSQALVDINVPSNDNFQILPPLTELKSRKDIAMEREKLTHAQKVLLNKCPRDWAILPVGCTNKTLLVLEKNKIVETRISKHTLPELSRWEWRINRL